MSVVINGSAGVTVNSGAVLGITSGTAVASTSGTSIDFTSIPSWVKRITVQFKGVSTSGTSAIETRIGTSGGVEATGYLGSASRLGASSLVTANSTTGFLLNIFSASDLYNGALVITNISGNDWVCNGTVGVSNTTIAFVVGSSKSLSGTLDRVRITTAGGTDTFDAGSINILYE